MWAVYDVFRLFSKGMQFKIDRGRFLTGLKDCVTLKQMEVVRRARLAERFRESAHDVTLEEFVRMYFPKPAEKSMSILIRWCHLREAQSVLHNIESSDIYALRTIFDLLDANGDQKVSVEELQHAEILTSYEVADLFDRAEKKRNALAAKALAAAALFGKEIEDCDYGQLYSTGCLWGDGKLSFQDFCSVVSSRCIQDSKNQAM